MCCYALIRICHAVVTIWFAAFCRKQAEEVMVTKMEAKVYLDNLAILAPGRSCAHLAG